VSSESFLSLTLYADIDNKAGVAQAQEPPTTQFTETFPDEMMFSLDFSDDRVWGLGTGDVQLFGGAGM
jgi:hypothetical protein